MNATRFLTTRWLCLWLSVILVGCATGMLQAQQGPSLEGAAAQLQKTVVTLRVRSDAGGDEAAGEGQPDAKTPSQVTVCSGVLLGEGRLVTSMPLGGDGSIRVTLPGGEQSVARVRVVDEYSGLSLLKIKNEELEGISCARELPRIGTWVVSGAGWGAEEAVISFGMVSGTEVAVPQTTFPPLLRCDMRIAKTSSGAAVTNPDGELIGIVVLTDPSREHGGWTYAVPAAHVLRLTRTLDESRNESSVLVLKRRRPVVGMVLDGDGNKVVVSRVREESPASKAGIQVGDEILAAGGVKIRSVYQALRPVLRKQPGDQISFLVRRGNRQMTVPVVLGGGVELPSASPVHLSPLVQPQIAVESLPRGGVRASSTVGEVREFGHLHFSDEVSGNSEKATEARKIQLLKRALDRYQAVVGELSRQLERSEKQHERAAARIEVLEKKLEERTSNGNSH
ncbi:MAG: PDZ domain-containing protein [Planctomycetota bacterium]